MSDEGMMARAMRKVSEDLSEVSEEQRGAYLKVLGSVVISNQINLLGPKRVGVDLLKIGGALKRGQGPFQ